MPPATDPAPALTAVAATAVAVSATRVAEIDGTLTPEQSGAGALDSYLRRLSEGNDVITVESNAIGGGLSNLSAHPNVISDPTWLASMDAHLAGLRAAGEQMQSLGPVPAQASRVNAVAVRLGQEIVAETEDASAGIHQADASRLRASVAHARASTDLLEQVNTEVVKLKAG